MPRSLPHTQVQRLNVLKRNVRRRLLEMNMRQTKASELAGYSRSWLGRWLDERESIDPGYLSLAALASVLNTTVEDLAAEDAPLPAADETFSKAAGTLRAAKSLISITKTTEHAAAHFLNRRRTLEVVECWLMSNGLLDERFDHLRDYFDVFAPRDHSPIPNIVHVGRQGLAATALEDDDPAAFWRYMNQLRDVHLSEIDRSIRSSIVNGGGTVTCVARNVRAEPSGTIREITFARGHLSAREKIGPNRFRSVILNIAHTIKV